MRSFHNRRAIIVIGLLAIAAGITAAFIADRQASEDKRLELKPSNASPIMFDGAVLDMGLADLTGDKQADLVTLTLGSGRSPSPDLSPKQETPTSEPGGVAKPASIPIFVTVRRGDGSGAFNTEVTRQQLTIKGNERGGIYTTRGMALAVRVVDLDGDNDLDVIAEATGPSPTQAEPIPGGTPTASSAQVAPLRASPIYASWAAQAWSNDGSGKLVSMPAPTLAKPAQHTAPTLVGDTRPGFRNDAPMTLLLKADFDGDNNADLLWENRGVDRGYYVQLANRDGFATAQPVTLRSKLGAASSLRKPEPLNIDLDRDGVDEVITETNIHTEVLRWSFENGDASLNAIAHIPMPKMVAADVPGGYVHVALGRHATGDIDADGDTDIVSAGWLPGSAAFAYLNNGGEFTAIKLAGKPASYVDKRNSPPGM